MTPLVSIVIPTYNRPVWLRQSLESCLQQGYANLEIIVVDDASEEATRDYVSRVTDPRVVYIRQPKQGGSVACLNAGFARAKGEYLTWSSDDDYFATEAIQRLVRELEADRKVDFVYAHYWKVDEAGHVLSAARVEDPEWLDRDNYVGHCFLYRRKVYEALGDYRPEPFLAEEYEYWLRVREKFAMKRISELLYYHRLHPAGLTLKHGEDKMQEAVARARRPYIPFWKHHYLTAERHQRQGRRWQAVQHALVSLLTCPVHGATWRVLILAITPVAVRESWRMFWGKNS